MPKNLDRRSFLKGTAAAAGAACVSTIPLPQAAQASMGGELATMLDLSKCIGCESCVEACQEANADYMPKPKKPYPKMFPARVPVEDWVGRETVTDRLTPYNWLTVQTATVEKDGEETDVYIPRRCMHCQSPPCANLCPFGAANKRDNGITVIDPEVCLGGAKCRQVCPWGIPQRQTGVGMYLNLQPMFVGNGTMYKCHRCYERLEEGEVPACIEACPEGVQTIGPREEILRQAHARAKEIGGYIYGEHENGGTNTIYVSPVPFEDLNKSIQADINGEIEGKVAKIEAKRASGKGEAKWEKMDPAEIKRRVAMQTRQGRPHLGPVEDTMAKAENMTMALFLAPVAGAALALGKMRRWFSSTGEDKKDE